MKVSNGYFVHPYTNKLIQPGELYGCGDMKLFRKNDANMPNPQKKSLPEHADKMSLAELKAIASDMGIESGGLRKNALYKKIVDATRDKNE